MLEVVQAVQPRVDHGQEASLGAQHVVDPEAQGQGHAVLLAVKAVGEAGMSG